MIEHGNFTGSNKPQDPWILTVSTSEDGTMCTDVVLEVTKELYSPLLCFKVREIFVEW